MHLAKLTGALYFYAHASAVSGNFLFWSKVQYEYQHKYLSHVRTKGISPPLLF
jgi:hypothetical protein